MKRFSIHRCVVHLPFLFGIVKFGRGVEGLACPLESTHHSALRRFTSSSTSRTALRATAPGSITWVLEKAVFPNDPLRTAVEKVSGTTKGVQHTIVDWNDAWWEGQTLPSLPRDDDDSTQPFVVFHGDLSNADRIAEEAVGRWSPGAYCNTDALHCSEWYPHAQKWLLHQTWIKTTVADLVEQTDEVLQKLQGAEESIFVRPDSPLKPFSGRVLRHDEISLHKLDHGFYYDDERLPIIVAPVMPVGEREWRFVVVDGTVVTGSAYQADGRKAVVNGAEAEAWDFAQSIASSLPPPDTMYVLDVCESENQLWLLELNPFSGADLYNCDGVKVLDAAAAFLLE